MINKVLVVCIGNICRSPMAEGLLRSELPGVDVSSAGVGAMVGYPADPLARQLMESRGIDISGHMARQVSLAICQQADVILVMDVLQRRRLENLYPFTRGKTFRINEAFKQDVPDPYGKDLQSFKRVLAMIDDGVHVWSGRIKKIIERERQLT